MSVLQLANAQTTPNPYFAYSHNDAMPNASSAQTSASQNKINGTVTTSPRKELAWLAIILVAGLLPRLAFAHGFPTLPISDFRFLVDFATAFQSDLLAKGADQWRQLSPGLPLLLSLVLRLYPRSPEATGRLATVILTSLVPLLPFLIWRGGFRLRTRLVAALMLALWPGQILFSTVVAQDNWVIPPTVALVALAVRAIKVPGRGQPVLAAVLYVAAVAIREEMLLILLPVAVVVAIGVGTGKRLQHLLLGSAVSALLVGALIMQRGLATGRYTLFTQHLGRAVLGAYAPGAGLVWIYPEPFMQAVRPGLQSSDISERQLSNVELGLAWEELLRRPLYHVSRIAGTTLLSFFEMDKAVTSWSLVQPGTLPQELRREALSFRSAVWPILVVYPLLLQILFASAVYFAVGDRSLLKLISPVLVPMLLKVGLHVIIVSQARYFLVVAALEMLAIAVVSESCFDAVLQRRLIRSLALGAVTIVALFALALAARGYVLQHMEPAVARWQLFVQAAAARHSITHEVRG